MGQKKLKARLFVFGKVQGVGFRGRVEIVANNLGLFGYVRNMPDGTVEVGVEGKKESIAELIQWMKAEDRSLTTVDEVKCVWGTCANEFTEFVVRY